MSHFPETSHEIWIKKKKLKKTQSTYTINQLFKISCKLKLLFLAGLRL